MTVQSFMFVGMAFDGMTARDQFAALRKTEITVLPNQVRVDEKHASQTIPLQEGSSRRDMICGAVVECDEETRSLAIRTGMIENPWRSIVPPNILRPFQLLVEFRG